MWWNNNEGGKPFDSECFFSVSANCDGEIKRPFTITEFYRVQEQCCASLMNRLTLNWHKSFAESLVHSVQVT